MGTDQSEDKLLRSVALQNARSIRLARERAERELIETREELRRSQQELTEFIENAAVAMQWVGPDGTILWANRNQLGMLGHTAEEYLGHHVAEFHADRAAIEPIIQQLNHQEALHEHAARLLCKDGSVRDVLITSSVFRRDGEFIHTRFFTRDVTERKQADDARNRLAAIVDSSEDAIISKDLNGVITSWNHAAERLFGYTPREAIGQPISMLIPADHLDEEPNILERIRRGERIEHYETVRHRKDKTLLEISLTVSPITDAQGRVVGASKIARDITIHKETEAKLRALVTREQEARAEAEVANRVKDEFLAMVSHELRTPLNAIVGWAQLLKSGKLDQDQAERAIETINRNAKAQTTIINDLLDVARIISGKLKLDMKPVKLENVIRAAIDVVRPAANAKSIEIVTLLDQSASPVAGESVRLQQVVWNLLTNAIKFTPQHGRVEIQLERAGPDVSLIVSDTGAGIPSDFLPVMFERFQQADTSAKRMHGGLGLGLSIVRNLVEMHGGSIRAESQGEGQGSRFTVTLPILAVSGVLEGGRESGTPFSESRVSEPVQKNAGRDADLDPDILNGLRLLAVDDQADTRDLLVMALTRYGAEARACTSANGAFKMIQDWKPDLIVSDIAMPGEDGYDLIQKIRTIETQGGGRIPAITLTGYASAEDERKAHASGYQVHMAKPVELRELVTTIATLLGRL